MTPERFNEIVLDSLSEENEVDAEIQKSSKILLKKQTRTFTEKDELSLERSIINDFHNKSSGANKRYAFFIFQLIAISIFCLSTMCDFGKFFSDSVKIVKMVFLSVQQNNIGLACLNAMTEKAMSNGIQYNSTNISDFLNKCPSNLIEFSMNKTQIF